MSSSGVGPFTVDNVQTAGIDYNCTDNDPQAKGGDSKAASKDIFTLPAMACRRAFIKSISSTLTAPKSDPIPEYTNIVVGNVVVKTVKEPTPPPIDGFFTKRVFRLPALDCQL